MWRKGSTPSSPYVDTGASPIPAVGSLSSPADHVATVLLALGYALALFHRTAFPSIAPQLSAEFGLNPAAVADLAAVFFWTYFVVTIPTGLLADAIGARRVAALGCVLTAIGSFWFRVGDSVVELTLARVLIAAGSPAAFIGLMRFVSVAFPDRSAMYAGRGILCGNVGAVCSGAPLAMLLGLIMWRDVWLGLGLVSLALAVIPFALGLEMRLPHPQRRPPQGPWRELMVLLSSRSVLLGVMLQAGLPGAFYAFASVVAPHWLAARGFGSVETGWMISLLLVGYGLGAAFWGWWGNTEQQRVRALMMAGVLAPLAWMVIAWMPPVGGIAIGALFLFIGGISGAFVLVYALITAQHPTSHAGGVVACVNCGIPLGAALLASGAGRLTHITAPWLLFAAGALMLTATYTLLADRKRQLNAVPIRSDNGAR